MHTRAHADAELFADVASAVNLYSIGRISFQHGRTHVQITEGRTDGRADVFTKGRTDTRTEGRTEESRESKIPQL